MARDNPNKKKEIYGLMWEPFLHPVEIERTMIQHGGKWNRKSDGVEVGNGLFFHYKRLQTLLWPEDAHHRWSDLMLDEILKNTVTAIQGPKDSSKTYCGLSKFGLTDYFCFPKNTLILMSSTDTRGLELRVWGNVKSLFQRAKERCPWLPGNLIDSKHAICTDNLMEDDVRDMRKGIIGIPCMGSGGQWTGGIEKFVGLKQGRRRLLADEASLMRASFLESLANLNSGDFKAVLVGNTLGTGDPLDKAAEPKGGWGSEGEITKTTVWDSRFMDGRTINLVGTDSPNFDYPENEPVKYPWLINRDSIARVAAFYGKDSLQYYSQCLGIRRTGLDARRVITRKLCKQFGAQDPAIWKDGKQTRIYAIDSAYGNIGGDRCVGGWGEFGLDVNNQMILRINPPIIIPVSVRFEAMPEDQIAQHVKKDCEENSVEAESVGYDSTGRGSLGTAFARIWSAYVNPIEFGGKATDRPVSADLMVWDELDKRKRLKRCDEQYSKFVTELWFSVRLIIESGQMRELPDDVMDEGCQREWKMVRGDKIEIETKQDMKDRMGRSPDLFDWLVVLVEMARRKGFIISKLSNIHLDEKDDGWREDFRKRSQSLRRSYTLESV